MADDSSSGSSGGGADSGTVVVVNAQFGEVVSVCVGEDEKSRECTGPIAPHGSAELEVPTGQVVVAIDPSVGERQVEVVTFSDEAGFSGVAAVGAAGPTARLETASLSAEQRAAGDVVLVNSVEGTPSVVLGDVTVGAWTSAVVSLGADRRVSAETGVYPFAITPSADSRGAWAVVLNGDATVAPDSELGLGGVFVSDGESHYSLQDGAVMVATPRYLDFYSGGPPDNVICVDGSPVAQNVIGMALAGPFSLPPTATNISLHDGTECGDSLIAERQLDLEPATRHLAAFLADDTVELFEEDFSEPSAATEYRILNFYLDSANETSTLWFGLIDDDDGSFLETVVAALATSGESAPFSFSAADATIGAYFMGFRFTPTGFADAEISWPHEDGARDWWVIWDAAFRVVDVSVWPWVTEE